jgi:hypothetical protein
MDPASALSPIPPGLRGPLLDEYREIIKNFSEHRWGPSELSGGRFSEVVYTILEGYGAGTYAAAPSKPSNFVQACRNLENNATVPRSFQILIPRMLPALYEVRSNRNVGHVGGDVDPNHMDATVVVGMCNWIMAELVRVFHALSTGDAQSLVDTFAERQIPLVWQIGSTKRLLDPELSLRQQILILLASSSSPVEPETLRVWSTYENKAYFKKLLAVMDKERLLYLAPDGMVHILPPGTALISAFLQAREKKLA